jgi:hypothetical protein
MSLRASAAPGTGDFRTGGPDAAEHNWWAYRQRAGEPTAHEAFLAGFARGSRWTVHTTGLLSPHIAQFIEFVDWLRAQPETEG